MDHALTDEHCSSSLSLVEPIKKEMSTVERLTLKLNEQQQQIDELGPVKRQVEQTIREKEDLKNYILNNPTEPVI